MKVAPSYKNWKIISFYVDDNGKNKAKVETKCDRCVNGVFVTRVENGRPIPHPNCGGVCFKCGGTGVIKKTVKAYTDEEYEKYVTNQQKAKEKKEVAAAAQKIQNEFDSEKNKILFLEKTGYDINNPILYVVAGGNTYNVKDKLKELGAVYDGAIGWYFRKKVELFDEYFLVEIPLFDVFDWNPYRKGVTYKLGAHTIVKERVRAATPIAASQWQGNIKDKLNLTLTCINKIMLENEWGVTTLYTFKDADNNIFTWFSSSCKTNININDTLNLVGTVKDHTTYDGVNQTVLTRCKVEKEQK